MKDFLFSWVGKPVVFYTVSEQFISSLEFLIIFILLGFLTYGIAIVIDILKSKFEK